MADVIPYFRFVAALVVGGLTFYFFNLILVDSFTELSTPSSVYWTALFTIFTYIPAVVLFRSGIRLIMYQQKRRF